MTMSMAGLFDEVFGQRFVFVSGRLLRWPFLCWFVFGHERVPCELYDGPFLLPVVVAFCDDQMAFLGPVSLSGDCPLSLSLVF